MVTTGKPICIRTLLRELIDVAILHPLRHHCELSPGHYHSQQRQHVWMTEGFPRYELLAKFLHGSGQYVDEYVGIEIGSTTGDLRE